MTLWELLGFKSAEKDDKALGDTDTVRKIVSKLEAMPVDEAKYAAAFAYVLGRVAYADREFSAEEISTMIELLQIFGGLDESQSTLVVDMAKLQAELFAGTENYLVTQEFDSISTRGQREEMLHCLFAVAAADDSISNAEDKVVRQIATELHFTQREFISMRAQYSDKLEVLKKGV